MAIALQAPTANERLKKRSSETVWLSLIVAAVVHILVFQLSPDFVVPDWRTLTPDSIIVIEVPVTVLPVAPEPIARPRAPVISLDADPTATIETVTFSEARELPPPPEPDADTRVGENRPFVVFDVAPRLLNPDEVNRALQRAYPAQLRDAGIGGVVVLQINVDEEGRAVDARVSGPSGYEALDRTAVELIDAMRFSPAMNRDRKVAVWVEIPIEFRTSGEG